jgi:hypothetical protein
VKELFFHATAAIGSPVVLRAFEAQSRNTLRPFNRYLAQSIHTAKQRQTRYQLPWEKVRNLIQIKLEPADSLLRFPRRAPGMLMTDWPAGKSYDLAQPGFVTNRARLVKILKATSSPDGLLVRADIPLCTDDRIMWCGTESGLRQEAEPTAPGSVTDKNNSELELRSAPTVSPDGRFWLIKVVGNMGDCVLFVDGEEVDADVIQATEELERVEDANGESFEVKDGVLRVETPPVEGLLQGSNGIRYNWSYAETSAKKGCWIQLLPSATSEVDEFIDSRAAFCEGDVKEVWTQPRHREGTTFKVKKVDQDRYQILLNEYPPEGTTLYLPVDVRNLHLQRRAIRQLSQAPLPHHQGLLRLCEEPRHARWPEVVPVRIPEGGWRSLTDLARSGTSEQRDFVQKALGTKDFAFLEGPPGSGKTTAICEIVQQLVEEGKRVLLCASTHVAIDNVLERLLKTESPIDAVRIGNVDKVDDNVLACQIGERIGRLVDAWRKTPEMGKLGESELEQMAERTIVMSANLTCGTTMGIINHPLIRGRDEDVAIWDRPISTMPHWDVLIIDEASKTLIQEFLVPAMMAKRWIIVGDIRQLPPFADRSDIIANLRDLVGDDEKPIFPPDHQRACLLLHRLTRREVRQNGARWLIVETPGVLEHIASELNAEPVSGIGVVRLIANGEPSSGAVDKIAIGQVREGGPEALRLAAADWVLVGDDIIDDVADLLPSNLLNASKPSGKLYNTRSWRVLRARQSWWHGKSGELPFPYSDKDFQYRNKGESVSTLRDCEDCESDWLGRNDLANQIAWRISRIHELKHSENFREKERIQADLHGIAKTDPRLGQRRALLPYSVKIADCVSEIEDIGLPSILEVLQAGIGVERAKRHSALTAGLRDSRPEAFAPRFQSLTFQHRMHPDISYFARDVIYEEEALHDANTIQIRDAKIGWDFGGFPSRRAWIDIDGRESGGVNIDEINAMEGLLQDFIRWARDKGRPDRDNPKHWEVACLCFYSKQEKAISDMLRRVTGESKEKKIRFFAKGAPVEIVCGTVDRFQGREADLVLLSMRNTRRTGFLDSPNRLNVAVTRARQQLVIFGNYRFYGNCHTSELEELAKRTPTTHSHGETPRRHRRR